MASSDNGKDSSTRGILREVLLLIFYVFLTFISVWVWRATSHPQLSGPARTDQHNSLQGEQPRELADDRNIDASENDFTLRLSKIMELRDSVESAYYRSTLTSFISDLTSVHKRAKKDYSACAIRNGGRDLTVRCFSEWTALNSSYLQAAFDPSDFHEATRIRSQFADGFSREKYALEAMEQDSNSSVQFDLATLEYEFSRASGINMGIDGAADDSIKIAAIADVNTLLADVQARLINYPPFAKVSGIGN